METDFLVVGSGMAGLNFAFEASKFGNVIVITKKKAANANTNFAQGGIAAVFSSQDNFEKHIQDTMKAGAYHNNPEAVKFMVEHAPEAIQRLISFGVPFDKNREGYALTREGGHTERRVLFVKDHTGRSIEQTSLKAIRKNPKISLIENAFAIDLIVKNSSCHGVRIIHEDKVVDIFAKATVLATGGLGQVFKYTTNPAIATGDGIAIAYRAGAKLEDMEFIQFHPTSLAVKGAKNFLLSEAVRGEGGILANSVGERFMQKYDERLELASRDIVAKAIYLEQRKGTVYLDIRHKGAEFLKQRFPTIYAKLLKFGIDMSRDLVPVTPAAHYLCGGIKADMHGRTSIKNLFAFGECACTGVHGANRLASNSLLEAAVFSMQVVDELKNLKSSNEAFQLPELKIAEFGAGKYKKQIKNIMWSDVGIVRNEKNLMRAIEELTEIEKILQQKLSEGISVSLLEAYNMAQAGLVIAKAALDRKQSLGCHFREDERNTF